MDYAALFHREFMDSKTAKLFLAKYTELLKKNNYAVSCCLLFDGSDKSYTIELVLIKKFIKNLLSLENSFMLCFSYIKINK